MFDNETLIFIAELFVVMALILYTYAMVLKD